MIAKYYVTYVAVLALACLCPNSQGQQPRDKRPQNPEDLIAYVKSADGKPVSGVEVKVVFFAGFGTPDISSLTTSSLTTSDATGKTRFSNDQNWRNWIKAEVAAKNKSKSRDESHDATEFKALSWCLSGYWPRANSRIELETYGRPGLWQDDEPVVLQLPELHATRIQVSSDVDLAPLSNVRLDILPHRAKKNTGLWERVRAFAWTDACGSALVWLPNGEYDVRWNTTTAAVGAKTKSDLFAIEKTEFGFLRPTSSSNVMGVQKRDAAFERKTFFWNDSQPPLRVENSPPLVYELPIEPPTVIVP
jgi:hypothetical protein